MRCLPKKRVFLSTPSGWRATRRSVRVPRDEFSISIHALRVEGDILLHYYTREIAYISIHALRVEGDAVIAYQMCNYVISIHALRVEGDRIGRRFSAPF